MHIGKQVFITVVTFLTTAFFTNYSYSQEPRLLKLAGTPWCPYTCDYNEIPGYATQYISALLKKKNIKVDVSFMKWENAIIRTHAGEFEGIITVSPGETSDILFTKTPTDSYQSCFYTLNDSQWQYTGIDSLRKIKLGTMIQYVYGEPLDNWLSQDDKHSNLYVSTGKNKLDKLIDQLQQQKIDVFVHDKHVLSHHLYRSQKQKTNLKEAGCLSESPFYFGLKPDTEKSQEIIDYLNQSLADKENQELKNYFKSRYGLSKYF